MDRVKYIPCHRGTSLCKALGRETAFRYGGQPETGRGVGAQSCLELLVCCTDGLRYSHAILKWQAHELYLLKFIIIKKLLPSVEDRGEHTSKHPFFLL